MSGNYVAPPPPFGKLDVQGRIRAAVDPMDMREFHDMINEVAAQHLRAIHVLGYVLGAVVKASRIVFGGQGSSTRHGTAVVSWRNFSP